MKGGNVKATEKTKFVNQLVDNVKKDILKKVEQCPDDWNGIELRWFIKDYFNLIVFYGFNDKRTKRYKEYKNHVICNNLV